MTEYLYCTASVLSLIVACILFYLFTSTKKKLSEYKTAVWILTGRLKRHNKIAKEHGGADVVIN